MKKTTFILIAAIYVASIVIVGVFGLKALNFEQTVFVTDIVLPDEILGEKVDATGTRYAVVLKYEAGLVVPIDFDKEPRDAQGNIRVTIIDEEGFDEDGATVATLEQGTGGYLLKFVQTGYVILRFEAVDGNKVSKELMVLVIEKSN